MTAICIVDTSVFCNILGIRNRSQHQGEVLDQLETYIQQGASLLLPIATIYETGNHIAQQGDGGERRQKAQLFVDQVRAGFSREAPWTPTPIQDLEEIVSWLAEFPDSAMREIGFGDLSILKIWEEQCTLHPNRRVLVWTYDEHLRGYDRHIIT
jgi:hypothetical protein